MAVAFLFVFMVFLASVQIETNSAIKIEIKPTRFKGDKEKDVSISCSLDEAEESAKEIMLLKIAKQGEKAIVIIHPNNTISQVSGKKDDYVSEGKIDDPVAKSYLKLMLKKPVQDDTGSYTCNIFYMDKSGSMVQDKSSSFLTVDDPQVKNFKVDIKSLKEKIKAVLQKIKEAGTTPLIAFSATNSHFIRPRAGNRIIFPDVITQIGNGYDPTSGVFRAPIGGLYSFSLMLKTSCITCYVRVRLIASGKVLFILKVGTYHDENQGFSSSAVQLREGDNVWPEADFVDRGATLTPNKLCIFSGHLINKYTG